MQATRLPLPGPAPLGGAFGRRSVTSPRRSAATRLSRQIATGFSSTRVRRQAGSHGRSQVRPRIPGKTLLSRLRRYDSVYFPCAISRMYSGTLVCAGQAHWQSTTLWKKSGFPTSVGFIWRDYRAGATWRSVRKLQIPNVLRLPNSQRDQRAHDWELDSLRAWELGVV